MTVETVAIEEDISFMKSMMSNREAHYSGCDKVTSSVINRRQLKSKQEEICVLNEKKRKSDQFLAYTDSYECEEESDSDFLPIAPSRSHKRIVKTGTNLHVPHDVLKSPIIVSALTRNKITPLLVAQKRKTISKIFCRLLKMTGAFFPINVKESLLPKGGL